MADEPPSSVQIDRWPVRHFENGRPANGRSVCWPPSPCELTRHLPNRLCLELFRTSESEISVLLKTVNAPLSFGECFLHFTRTAWVLCTFSLFLFLFSFPPPASPSFSSPPLSSFLLFPPFPQFSSLLSPTLAQEVSR